MSIIRFGRLLKSFKYAASGLLYAFKEEQNFRFHIVSAVFVVVLMIVLKVSKFEAFVLIVLIALVLMAELINSIFERFVDILKPRLHPYAERVKDMMAAVVLMAAIAAATIGLWIFIPHFLEYFIALRRSGII